MAKRILKTKTMNNTLIFIAALFILFLIFRIITTIIKERARSKRLASFKGMTIEKIEAITKYESVSEINIDIE